MTHGSASVYMRGNEILVAPQGGRGGLRYAIEPVLHVRSRAEALASALTTALRASAANSESAPLDLRNYQSPLIACAHECSDFESELGLAVCRVDADSPGIRIQPMRPAVDSPGFEYDGPLIRLPEHLCMNDVAERVLEILRASPVRLNETR